MKFLLKIFNAWLVALTASLSMELLKVLLSIYVRVIIYKGAEKILGIFELTLKRAFVFN